jgi:hypothetical protein
MVKDLGRSGRDSSLVIFRSVHEGTEQYHEKPLFTVVSGPFEIRTEYLCTNIERYSSD